MNFLLLNLDWFNFRQCFQVSNDMQEKKWNWKECIWAESYQEAMND